uniref:Dehydration-responsive element-binding protein 1A2 n=1 Tax=Stevia rebaudiana TaxID=55670 RepID=A0A7L4XUS3_STERE|nr:dehydration-responsive element-binding protein 1A2 [Stevia rebaudiana]
MTIGIQLSPENTPTETSSSSDCSTGADEEVKLASRNPKKRAGRKKFRETRHPVFRGVRRRDSGKWVCEVRQPNNKTRVWLGTYPTADMAARAHDVAVLAMRGRSACLNFADSLWRLPVPKSGNVKDIQMAAVKAAEAFGQTAAGVTEMEERSDQLPENELCMDDEVIFGMPGFLADMAEGLMLPPPRIGGYDTCQDDFEFFLDTSLWSF